MSRTPPLSNSVLYLAQSFRRGITRIGKKRDMAVQTSPIFRLPCEIFQEILLNLPVLPWTEVYHRHLCVIEDVWLEPASKSFWERTRTLLTLSVTCRAMRQAVLMEAWKVCVVCTPGAPERYAPWVHGALVSQYRVLLANPHLATNVRTLAVDFVFDCDKLSALFVNCLATFPNLHTLEIGSTPNGLVLESLTTTALGKRKLPVRTLALPPTAHFLLRYCPNIEDLTCGPTAPTEAFVESLVVGGLNLVTKLSVSCRGGWSDTGPSVDICPKIAAACPEVRELSVVHARRWGEPSLPLLKGSISSFKNLSTITFIHRLESHWGPEDYVHTDWMNGGLDPVWSEITDLAISQLGSSTAGGPKMLKAVTVWGGDSFGPEVVVEEVVV